MENQTPSGWIYSGVDPVAIRYPDSDSDGAIDSFVDFLVVPIVVRQNQK